MGWDAVTDSDGKTPTSRDGTHPFLRELNHSNSLRPHGL